MTPLSTTIPSHRFSVAPMLDWTTRQCRFFHRLLSKNALLYTEMVTTGALIYGDRARYLAFDETEHPVALQLGGSEPSALAQCAHWAESLGYDEINLNVGCPSTRVQSGSFGACLMAEPQLVADGIKAMMDVVSMPVTVKHRIGIDEQDSYAELVDFVGTIAETGCDRFIIHARKAWLKGLSPKQNREIPPLRYDVVEQLKQDFPHLNIIINGGIRSLEEAKSHLTTLDGVMLGREVYQNPWILSQVDQQFYQSTATVLTPEDIIDKLMPYVESEFKLGSPIGRTTRHILGLFQGQAGARSWRRYLSEHAHKKDAPPSVIPKAVDAMMKTRRILA